MGEASVATDPTVTSLKVAAGSAATLSSSAMMLARLWPGKTRQLMLAVARWGRALSAWPPLIMVATQVVPIRPMVEGSADRVAMAALSVGSAAKAFMAAPILGSSYLASLTKAARLSAFSSGLN